MTDFKALEHEGWTQKARHYDDHFAGVTRQAISAILDGIGTLSGRSFLDICCGTGDLAQAAVQADARVTGVDFAEAMVEIARRKVPEARFHVGDAEQLDLDDASFDAAACAFGLWHLPNADSAIAEAARVLTPGGTYCYTAWLPPDEGWDLMGLLLGAINRHGTMDVDLPPSPPPFRFATPEEAAPALRAAGFASVSFQKAVAIWKGRTADEFFDLLYKSVVRAPMLLEAQTPEAKRAVVADMTAGAEAFRTGDHLTMRWPYMLAVARKD